MSGAREFLEQLQQGQEVNFTENAIKLPMATRELIAQALLATIPPTAPVGLALMVSDEEFWFLFDQHAHHVTTRPSQQAGGRIVDISQEVYTLGSLDATQVLSRFQKTGRDAQLVYAELTFKFARPEPFALNSDYQGDDRTTLSPRAILAFAQALLQGQAPRAATAH